MKKIIIFFVTGVFLLNACSAATGIEISNAWTRPALKGGNGAVYFLLQNHSAGGDTLISISTDVAEAAEMHESKMEGDVMQMRQLMSISIGGKESIEFKPGGYHIMLVGLKQELRAGDEIQVTLRFKDHEAIQLTVPVQEINPNDSISNH